LKEVETPDRTLARRRAAQDETDFSMSRDVRCDPPEVSIERRLRRLLVRRSQALPDMDLPAGELHRAGRIKGQERQYQRAGKAPGRHGPVHDGGIRNTRPDAGRFALSFPWPTPLCRGRRPGRATDRLSPRSRRETVLPSATDPARTWSSEDLFPYHRRMRFIPTLRLLSLIEGISTLILLGIAMPLKYAAGMPLAVTIAGTVHGALFTALALMLLIAIRQVPLPISVAAIGLVAAVLPGGPFLFDRMLREER
jgi:integral membrane protein